MLKACAYCGRIHDSKTDCGRKHRGKYERKTTEHGRYSNAFREKSQEIKQQQHFLCAVCLAEGRLNYNPLETHHIIKLVERPDLLTEDSNLIALCKRHHVQADSGEIDAGYLRSLVELRESPGGLT